MASESLPCLSYLVLYIFSVHVLNINSRASTHWKLDTEGSRVIQVHSEGSFASNGEEVSDNLDSPDPQPDATGSSQLDAVLNILTAPLSVDNGGIWTVKTRSLQSLTGGGVCVNCKKDSEIGKDVDKTNSKKEEINKDKEKGKSYSKNGNKNVKSLDCGRAVNHTFLDHLPGVANRHNHTGVPEPEVAIIFNMKTMKADDLDLVALESELKKQKQQMPKSARVYNKIGNLLRIKGETSKSIECYRKAIHFSPTDSEAILNLARVMYNLQYLDDAIFLVKQSLELQPIGDDTWLHHFTLGEILKAYGHYQEALLHFRHALELNPNFQLAEIQMNELESWSDSTVTIYTSLIIFFLVLTVLFFILSSLEGKTEVTEMLKPQRHFSRAMAMKSIRHTSSRAGRVKKNHS